MLQQTANEVWGYGAGMARSVARVTQVGPLPTDVTTEGALRFERQGVGEWLVDLDALGVTELRYLAARMLQGAGAPDYQALLSVVPGSGGNQYRVSIRDMAAGNPGVVSDIPEGGALVVDVITDQTGVLDFSYGPQLPAPPVPPPGAPERRLIL